MSICLMLIVYGYGEANGEGWYIYKGALYDFIQNPFIHHILRILIDMALILVLQLDSEKAAIIARIWLIVSVMNIILSAIIVHPLILKVKMFRLHTNISYLFFTLKLKLIYRGFFHL